MQLFSILSNYRYLLPKNTLFGTFMVIFLSTFFSVQNAVAQLPDGFEPLEQARIVKRINIRQIPADGIIRFTDENCTLGAHVAGVRLVYARNDHKSLQGQDWGASLSYNLLSPQDLDNQSTTPITLGTETLAIGEQTTAPYLQTFIAAKTHTLDYSTLGYRHNDAEIRIQLNGLPVLTDAPDAIWLELELYETSKLPFNPTQNNYHFMARQAGNDIVAAWDYVETAYEYELEWVWIDKAETQGANPDSDFDENWITTDPEKIFDYREGVTVQTTDQHFIFPNTFLQGRVFYRMRAIGRFMPENVPQHGDWNYGYDKVTHTKQQALVEIATDYETTHNWQSVTSFAENAKYKTVVSYHDGTGRNRQVVTHLSSEKRTLIAETLYDYEGNPTVNILPVSLEGTNLSYHENLNPFVDSNPFSKDNYDNGSTSTALSTSSGAAQYYSANNTSGGRYAERLPDAQGFAYSRTTYLRDGTGRVREQGGLGATYQVGSEHSTKMFYGSTNDSELKRLFGSNVGKASFYRKQITQDPNGQLSVSYLDAAGQVIATALTGEVPQNVLALESYNARSINVDLKENNIKDELNRRSLSENTIFNNIPGTEYNFTYSVDGKTSTFMNQCLTCQYELSISIYDENGQGVEFIDPANNNQPFATGLFTQTIDPASCTLQDYDIDFTVTLPEIGTYQVRKELKVISSEEIEAKLDLLMVDFEATAYTKYEQEALANNPCDICFTCFPADYNPLELFEGMDCESILAQIENAVAENPTLYPTVESHPEYCHVIACRQMAPSKTFILDLSRVFDWTEASTNPTNNPNRNYILPTTLPPVDERQALEDFIDQNPLFTLYPSNNFPYRDNFVMALLKLSAFNGGNLSDAQNPTISIWDFIDHTVTPASHPALFDPNNENMPFQGVDLNDNDAIAERKWDLFRSRYLYEYEKIKENILNNEYSCTYLADQDIAIVKDPTLIPENDTEVTAFTNDFNAAIAPNCDMQVQIWMGQLQNSCDNLTTAQWATIENELINYCSGINPQENPLAILYANDLALSNIQTTIAAACPEANETLATLFQTENCALTGIYETPSTTYQNPQSVVNLWMSPLQADITMPEFDQRDITIQFFHRGSGIGGLLKIGDIEFKGIGHWYAEDNSVSIAGTTLTGSKNYVDFESECKLYTLTIEHTTTERIAKLYNNNQLVAEQNTPITSLSHGGKMIIGAHNIQNINTAVGSHSKIWDIKIWEGIRSQSQITADAGILTNGVPTTPIPTQLLAHWTLQGGDLTDIAPNPNGMARNIPSTVGINGLEHPIGAFQNIYWNENCCTPNTENPYAPIDISLAEEKEECEKRFKEIGKRDAQIIIDRKRNELRAELIAKYNQDCLDTEETFKYTYTTAEHHYTLYYYDQAGNLVQTVSPEGVNVLTDVQVANEDEPEHNLKTRYKYNSLNAPIDQETPDAGKSEFFYDKVARIRLSQNAQQETDGFYSYTKYDKQGRITEVGQLEKKADGTNPVFTELEEEIDNITFPSETDYVLTQITRTFYDDQAAGTPTQITPKNLRGRIAAVKVFEDGQTQGAATFYDYDIHGNVEKLVQKLPDLDPKTVEYSYDLLSGNVHRVTYQKGETDQFMHRYRYDADNRLEAVFTSSDGYIWDEDARYLYYAHGPMARVELGEYKVQGVDYYYTLQGWIKGVNLQGDHDAEAANNVQKYVSKDAFGYALHYYQNDYQSINGNFGWNASSTTDLFNGNIAAMSTTLKTAGEQTMLYRYDQLNRIKTAVASQNTYQTGYSYDANGNILSLLRNDHNNATIDNLSYTYNTTQNNRLNKLRDNSNNNTGFTSSSTPFSYQYDNIGNLIEDEEKDITSVRWTVYGKVASVTKNDTEISYQYDATGNRIYKKVVSSSVSKETHYVRDASGNLMATYENKIAKEFVIYGSSRLGIYNGSTSEGKRTLGNKKYELSNHLGNVLSVISDNKIGIDSDTDLVADYYEPYIVSESDYYPFGMTMEKRSSQNQEYLFAFQGQEKNEEIGTVHYKYRESDPVTGRFWSVDPLAFEYAYNSPFAFSENRVIDGVELEGREFFGAGFVIQELADGLAELGLPRVAGFVETYGHALIIDPSYTTYKATKSIQEDPSAWNVTKQLDPTGLTSIPDAVETVVKASEGDERAQGQVVGMVVVVAGGAKAVKTVKAGGTKTKAPANKSQTPHGGSSNPKNTKTTQSNSSPNKSLSAEEFEALIKSTGADKVTVYHKGNLVNNSVTSGRAFSTGKDIKSVIALDRAGKVHQFDIPKEVFNKWVKNNQATTKKDLDFATGVYNEEVLFSPEISGELNKYKVK